MQELFPFTATVSPGALATLVMVPLVPTPTAGGPDLVASVVASAPGTIGSIKPKAHVKLTNLGSSMIAATPLQIELVASTDDGLDSTDLQLLTTTTPPLLLKAKQIPDRFNLHRRYLNITHQRKLFSPRRP